MKVCRYLSVTCVGVAIVFLLFAYPNAYDVVSVVLDGKLRFRIGPIGQTGVGGTASGRSVTAHDGTLMGTLFANGYYVRSFEDAFDDRVMRREAVKYVVFRIFLALLLLMLIVTVRGRENRKQQ